MAGQRSRRPVRCQGWNDDGPCNGVATWRKEWAEGAGEAGYACGACGWALSEHSLRDGAGADLEPVDDGRIRGPEDVAPRIAGARARRDADPVLAGRDVALALHELYCSTAESHAWVEIVAADSWAEVELTQRLGRRVHRTQVRRERLTLEELGYVRRIAKPRGFAIREITQRHRTTKRTKAPIVLEVLKAKKEESIA